MYNENLTLLVFLFFDDRTQYPENKIKRIVKILAMMKMYK